MEHRNFKKAKKEIYLYVKKIEKKNKKILQKTSYSNLFGST